jgi:hypothetical protein
LASNALRLVSRAVGEAAPVQPELELHDESGRDADRVVDHVERAPEPGHPAEFRPAADDEAGLGDRDERHQAEREDDEEEMDGRRDGELQAREVQGA